MSETWFISDTHFGHTKCWDTFKDADGNPMRPFSSTEEMDETMIERWNEVVRPHDKVIHLGDVVINKKNLHHLSRLNGSKRLVMGNHDLYHVKHLQEYFSGIFSMRILDGLLFTHIPVHPRELDRFGTNVHGHLHSERVKMENTRFQEAPIDPRYFSVCVEQIDYRPISLGELKQRIFDQQEAARTTLPTIYKKIQENRSWGNGSKPQAM